MSSIASRSTLSALLLLPLAVAACGGEDQPGALGTEGAHEHGVARVNVAVEGSTATIEFVSPAMGIYGFEHEAVSEEDRARQSEGLETLRTRFASMFVMDEGLGCTFTPVHVGLVGDDHAHEDEHAHEAGDEHAHEAEDDHAHEAGDEHTHEDEHAHQAGDDHAHEAGDDQAPADAAAAAPGQQTAGEEAHEHDHAHAEVTAEFTVSCDSPLSGSRLAFAVGEVFPGIESLDVQVLADQVSGGRYQASGTGVEL